MEDLIKSMPTAMLQQLSEVETLAEGVEVFRHWAEHHGYPVAQSFQAEIIRKLK